MLLSHVFSDMFDDMFIPSTMSAANAPRLMNSEVREYDDHYELHMELAGFKKEDIKVDIDDDILVIKAEHSEDKDEKNDNGDYIRRERYYGSYTRSFNVSEINVDGITASYENGVLTLTMPKKVPVKPESKHLEIM